MKKELIDNNRIKFTPKTMEEAFELGRLITRLGVGSIEYNGKLSKEKPTEIIVEMSFDDIFEYIINNTTK